MILRPHINIGVCRGREGMLEMQGQDVPVQLRVISGACYDTPSAMFALLPCLDYAPLSQLLAYKRRVSATTRTQTLDMIEICIRSKDA